MITLRLLVENQVHRAGLLAEHGLAWWIDTGTHRVLFDTGQGMALRRNARRLGIDLGQANAIALSHGHYDHTGGLPIGLRLAQTAALHFHPAAAAAKFSGASGSVRRISTRSLEQKRFPGPGRRVIESRAPIEVVPGVWLTGEIPRANGFEDVGGLFFLDAGGSIPDPILDDQALFFEAPDGIVVVLGCAHAGIVNTMAHIATLTGGAPVAALLGGGHLGTATPGRLRETVRALRANPPGILALNHCTGVRGTDRLRRAFGNHWSEAHVGDRWEF